MRVQAGARVVVTGCWAQTNPADVAGLGGVDLVVGNADKPRLPDLRARRTMLTHMNPTMLCHLDEVRAAGALVAEDGAVMEF